ncbi:MAG: hypothetical protein J0I35_20570 [Devosia sp.]|nr:MULTISPECIES: hypothetical protein [unclassified Devosia]MBN9307617.1 hypothetical protein [Devosia sp.]
MRALGGLHQLADAVAVGVLDDFGVVGVGPIVGPDAPLQQPLARNADLVVVARLYQAKKIVIATLLDVITGVAGAVSNSGLFDRGFVGPSVLDNIAQIIVGQSGRWH